MKVILLILLLLLAALLALSSEIQAQTLLHDVSVDAIPSLYDRTSTGFATALKVRITNRGSSTEVNVPATCTVKDKFGNFVYRDTLVVASILSGQTLELNFADFTPITNGRDQCCTHTFLVNDQKRDNDTTCTTVFVAYEQDIQALSITTPKLGDSIA